MNIFKKFESISVGDGSAGRNCRTIVL